MLLLASALLLAAGPAGAAPAPRPVPATPSAAPAGYDAELAAGDAALAELPDPARLEQAVAHYAAALALRPGDRRALVATSRAQALRAQASPAAAKEAWRQASRMAELALRGASPAFAQAVDRGEDPGAAAASVGAAGAEPLYWFALATMGMAQDRGMAAVLAVKDAARLMMERAAQLDERVDHGGPRRALGSWLATLPSAAGGGVAAARTQLERARVLFPACQLTRVREAETLAVLLQDRKRFEELLGEVLAFEDARAPELAAENRLARALARDLLSRRDRLF